jgi:hypothetical protein
MKNGVYYSLLIFFIFGTILLSAQPAAPENLTAVQGSSTFHPVYVKLNWTSTTNMARFNLYRKDGAVSDTGSFIKRVSGIRGLFFNDMRVMPGQTYSYYVTAINSGGESSPSSIVEITLTAPAGGGTVTGVITDDNTLLPITDAAAVFHKTSGHLMGIVGRTDANGVYNVNLPAGSYYMKTMAYGYYFEFYNNVPTLLEATPVEITEGAALTLNVGLAPYVPPVLYTLSGIVKDSLDEGIPSVVRVYSVRRNTFHRFMHSVRTDSLGSYSINVRENDTVVVMAVPFNKEYYPEFYNNKFTFAEADRVPVTGNITDIDFVLSHKPVYQNGINGVVVDAQNIPVESFVSAFRLGAVQMRRYLVSTDAAGVYSFSNLIPGKYILRVDPKEGYLPTYFKYDGTQTINWREADSVMVDAESIIPNINFNVLPLPEYGEGIIAGNVSTSAGENVDAAYVYALNGNGEIIGYGISNSSGNYSIDGLLSGEYQITSDKLDYNFTGTLPVTIDYSGNLYQTANINMNPASVTDVKNPNPQTVTDYQLSQNYPNPFNPVTNIKFSLPERSNVRITVYNLLGIQVAELVNEVRSAGTHTINFDASDLSSGVYFYKIEAGKFIQTKKLTLLK